MNPIILDNFLPEFYHQSLMQEILYSRSVPWTYIKDSAAYPNKIYCDEINFIENQNGFQHVAYKFGESTHMFGILKPMLNVIENSYNIKIKQLFRIRIGMSIKNGEIGHHFPHVDMRESHKTFLYYLNNSDGETVFYKEKYNGNDPEKLTVNMKNMPKENQGVLFDGLQYHSSGNPNKNYDRITININFL